MTSPALVNGANRTQRGSKPQRPPRVVRGLGGLAPASGETAGAAARCAARRPRRRGSRRGRAVVARRVEAVPVPIRTVVSPSTRWIGEAVSVDRAHPVERRGQHVLVEQAATELHPALGDPEAGGQVPQHPRAIGTRRRAAFHRTAALPPDAYPPRSRPSSTGRNRISSRIGCTSSIRRSSRCHSRLSTSGSAYGLTGSSSAGPACLAAGVPPSRGVARDRRRP